MNQLISLQPQTINGNAVETVSARELHSFLESKQDFSTWIKSRVEKYGFTENADYTKLHKKMELSKTGQVAIEYYITLDMAKQLAMVENNDKGMQARKYFIECEKQLKEVVQHPVQPIGELEDKIRVWAFVISQTSLAPVAQETLLITTAEQITGIAIPYRPQIEQTTYSAKELGDVLGVSANMVGRLANKYNLKVPKYGLYYLSKSQNSDKQVETWRYYECVIDEFKTILEAE